LDKTSFALTVDKQVIYFDFFKPGISGASCDHSINMDIAWSTDQTIVLRLGYPGGLDGFTIDDQRNTPGCWQT
jgi:hypothetical protein